MAHPNISDKIRYFFDHSYLYHGQICKTTEKISAGIVRKILSKQSFWKLTNYITLPKSTQLRFISPAKKFKNQTDIPPTNLFFELVNNLPDSPVFSCDTVTLTKADQKLLSTTL